MVDNVNMDGDEILRISSPLMLQLLQYINTADLNTADILRILDNLRVLNEQGFVGVLDFDSVIGIKPITILIPYDTRVTVSVPDYRDYSYTIKIEPDSLRESVDLRQWDSIVESQANIGSCVGNSITNAYELIVKQKDPDNFVELSRLFVYYNSRLIEGLEKHDAGTSIRSALKSCQIYGICTEKLWPYDVEKFAVEPTKECYEDGLKRKITNYRRLYNLNAIMDVLNDNYPAIVGISIYRSFYYVNQSNPVISLPSVFEEYEGDHAVCMVGYDTSKKLFLIKNSFGNDWGDQGYAWLPFEYCKKYMFEAWVFDII